MRIEIGKYIVIDTEICHGKPTFKGTRVLVSDIIELLACGESVEKILNSYPSLTKEMIEEAMQILKGEYLAKVKVLA